MARCQRSYEEWQGIETLLEDGISQGIELDKGKERGETSVVIDARRKGWEYMQDTHF